MEGGIWRHISNISGDLPYEVNANPYVYDSVRAPLPESADDQGELSDFYIPKGKFFKEGFRSVFMRIGSGIMEEPTGDQQA